MKFFVRKQIICVQCLDLVDFFFFIFFSFVRNALKFTNLKKLSMINWRGIPLILMLTEIVYYLTDAAVVLLYLLLVCTTTVRRMQHIITHADSNILSVLLEDPI